MTFQTHCKRCDRKLGRDNECIEHGWNTQPILGATTVKNQNATRKPIWNKVECEGVGDNNSFFEVQIIPDPLEDKYIEL